jgi:hypothetical protein
MEQHDLEHIARQMLLVMITRFGVRPNGSVQINDLSILVQGQLQLDTEDIMAGIDFAVGRGWVVQQQNGLIRITEAGYKEA